VSITRLPIKRGISRNEDALDGGVVVQAKEELARAIARPVDAPERENVERFMAPFAQVGTVEISPASRCEAVVARAAC